MGLRVGLIGLGRFGWNHAKKLDKLKRYGEIDGFFLCDSNESRMQSYSDFLNIRKTTDYKDFTNGKLEVNAVIIVTDSESHYEISKHFLEKGIHVFVEKPMCMKSKESKHLKEIAENRNLILMTGHLLRYHPAVRTLARMIEGGKFGRIYYIYCYNYKFESSRKSEGTLYALAIHNIDMACYLLRDQAPCFIVSNLHFPEGFNYDFASHLTMGFSGENSSSTAYLFQSWLTATSLIGNEESKQKNRVRGIRVIGEKLSAKINYDIYDTFLLIDCPIPLLKDSEKFDEVYHFREEVPDQNYKLKDDLLFEELLDFVKCVKGAKEEPINSEARHGHDPLEIIEMARRSYDGRKIVPLKRLS